MSDDLDIFGEDDLAIPTMRGSANLDVQDYARGPSGDGSSILDDELQEDIPSRPGDGAGPAFDIDGMTSPVMDDENGPGMEQTTYGDHPWGPGGSEGYRPASMQRTGADLSGGDDMRQPKALVRDSMTREPEVVMADRAMAEVINTERGVPVQRQRWSGNRNQMPSNRAVDPETIYDRSSYEYDDSSQDTIGSGIFGMEEGVTWRPRDGIFAHQFALPGYIGAEDELGVQQSEMWDTTANNWRVTQVSASGVPLKRRVDALRPGPAYSPFVDGNMPEMRPEATGPRSHIEAFGRKAAAALIEEARTHRPETRSQFMANALEALGPGMAMRATAVAQRLVKMGYPPEAALEDVVAHCVMHAAMSDLTQGRGTLPRLDRLASRVARARPKMQQAAAKHVAPMVKNERALRADLGALMNSPARRGMGQVAPDALAPVAAPGLFSTRNLLIAGVLGVGGWFAWQNRRAIQRNAKKLGRNAKKLAKKIGVR